MTIHKHDNQTNIDLIDQDLSSLASPTFASVVTTKTMFFGNVTGSAANDRDDNYSGRLLTTSGDGFVSFFAPQDFISLTKLVLIGYPVDAGAAGAGKDIDIFSSYGANGASITQHSGSDTSTTYDTGTQNVFFEIDISSIYGSLAANDRAGLQVLHNTVGGNIFYIGILMEYQ